MEKRLHLFRCRKNYLPSKTGYSRYQSEEKLSESFQKARIYKSNAQGRADSIAFNETDGIMHMYTKPILWSGEKQVTGDKSRSLFQY